MSEPFLGEIRAFSFNFVPKGWAQCAGQLMPINQNQALFSILGTTYGGDGRVTFALPDLRGRSAVHPDADHGGAITLGAAGGEEAHTLTAAETPVHALAVNLNSTTRQPTNQTPARRGSYGAATGQSGSVGGGQPHENRQPYLAMTYAIALQGIFPSRN
jgi:microcystin-dependent protein